MADSVKSQISKRSRYWRKRWKYQFRWHNGQVTEERTGLVVRCRSNRFVIGAEPGNDSRTYYFDQHGCPTEETRRQLHEDFRITHFVERGRFLPRVHERPKDEKPKSWNAYLHSEGEGVIEDHTTDDDTEQRRSKELVKDIGAKADSRPPLYLDMYSRLRDLLYPKYDLAEIRKLADWLHRKQRPLHREGLAVADDCTIAPTYADVKEDLQARPLHLRTPSNWRRDVLSRLRVLFDRDYDDALIHRLADFLCREECWHEWRHEPDLEPLRQYLEATDRWQYISGLEGACFRRVQAIRSKRFESEPFVFAFDHAAIRYAFVIPKRRPNERESTHKKATLALQALVSLTRCHPRHRTGLGVAAVSWISRRYIEAPPEWSQKGMKLAQVAEFFGVPPRSLRHAVARLRRHPHLGWAPLDRVLKSPAVRLTKPVASARASLLEASRLPEAKAANKMLDEANRLEHGWKLDQNIKRPTPAQIGRARRLRKKGLQELRSLAERTAD